MSVTFKISTIPTSDVAQQTVPRSKWNTFMEQKKIKTVTSCTFSANKRERPPAVVRSKGL